MQAERQPLACHLAAGRRRGVSSKGPSGVAPGLSDADLQRVAEALGQGASAHGFTGQAWTLRRIAQVVQRQTGVRYHVGHLWAILHQRMGWSVQRPVRRATERDEAAIQQWVAVEWPRIKANARRRKARIVCFDESGRACCPTCAAPGRRSAAHRCCGTRSTGSGPRWRWGCALGSVAAAAAHCFHVRPGSYDTASLIEVLTQLRVFLAGEKATLLWDGLPGHRSKAMAAFLATQRDWLVVERLPGYAPELNPASRCGPT